MSLRSLVDWFRGTNALRREMGDLNRLTDRDLRDIGVTRYDIATLAKNLKENPVGR